MKKNIENIVSENVVMDNATREAIIEDNMHLIPKNQLKRFLALPVEEQIAKIQYYQERAVKIEQMRQTASIVNKVRDLFDKRHASIDDAKQVIEFAQEFVDNFRQHQIEEIDKQIAELEAMKEAL